MPNIQDFRTQNIVKIINLKKTYKMKKLSLILVTLLSGGLAFSQTADDLAKKVQCDAIEAELAPIIKSSEHPKRGTKSLTWIRLGDTYVNYASQCGKDSTAADKALSAYKKALELEGEDGKATEEIKGKLSGASLANAFLQQGVYFYNKQDNDRAAANFLIAMDVNKEDSLAAFYGGVVSQQAGNLEDANRAFERYISLGGTDPVVYYSLASNANAAKDYDTAIDYLKKGSAKNPEDKDLKNLLINIYLAANKIDEAIADLEELVKGEPDNTGNLLNLGILYDNKDEDDKALMYYKKVLEIEPDNFDANFNLGVFYFNVAVKDKGEIDNMTMDEYRKRGKEVEAKVCKEFRESLPYFQRCAKTKPEDNDIKANLETLDKVLAQCD